MSKIYFVKWEIGLLRLKNINNKLFFIFKLVMKIFIVTDERCGGTVFTRIFNDVFNMKTIDDPQTGVNRKFPNYNKKDNLLDYLFNTLNYEVVKCCFCSLTNEEYFKLLDYCKINKVKMMKYY